MIEPILKHGGSEIGQRIHRLPLSASQLQFKSSCSHHLALRNKHNMELCDTRLLARCPGNVADNWKVWKQMWSNYMIIAQLEIKPPAYKVALFLHCIGVDALKIFNV